MSTLTEVRADLSADVAETGYPVLDTARGGIAPPCVIITHSDPWVEQSAGRTFDPSEFVVHLDMILLAGTGTNGQALETVELMAARVILSLPPEWKIERVSQPYLTKPNVTEYLTCQIQVSRVTTLTTEG